MISFNKKIIGILIFIFLTLSVLSLSSCGKTVKFNLSFIVDESVYAVIDTSGDEIVSMPQDPYKEGFIFDGWFWDKDKWLKPFTANSLLETPLSSDLKVYAKFIVAYEEENPIIIKAEGFSMDGKTGYISVSNNDTIFSFIDKIQVSAGAIWQISTDIYGKDIIPTKTVSLDIGDNTYYLLVSSSDETNINLYTMIVRRKPIYKVEFNTNGGSNVDVQYVEEGGFIEEVTTKKLGYTFIKWDYDFLSSVNSDLLVSAIWEANRDTPYEVRYYLENLDGSVSEFKKERLEGTTDSIVYPEIKKVEHYYCGTPNVFGKVYPDGSLILNIYYYRNEHSVNLTNENSDAGEIKGSGIYKYGEQVKISATTNEGSTWLGWYNGDELISSDAEYSFVMDEQNYELTAKWVAYTVTTTTNDEEAGEFTAYIDKKVTVGDTVTLSATTNEGYTWLGWYNGDEHISADAEYSFVMDEQNYELTAKWVAYTVTTTTNDEEAGEFTAYTDKKVTVGDTVTLSATTNEGYTWLGWYNGDKLISADAEYSFVMDEQNYELTAKWVAYTVTTTTNDEEAGEFTAYTDKKVTVGDMVTLSATTNEGYTWLGWYSENQLVSLDLEYSFTMGENDCIFSAHWMICPVDIVVNDEDVIVVNGMPEETVIGQEIFLSARLLKLGYNFDGWFIEDELICNEQEYKITLTMDKTTYTVNCSLDIAMENFDFISDEESCKINGVKDDSVSEIIVPKYVTTIGFGAFSSCANLKTISLPFVGNEKGRGVNDYFGYIFGANNYNENNKFVPSTLTTVNISAGVEIDAFAFKDCSSIIDCSLPDGLERIESGAFSGCENLKNINIPDSIHFIDSLVFNNCNNLLFNEKDGSYYLGNEGNPYLVLYKVTDQRNFNFFGETKIIYENAFFGLDLLTKIYIPGTVLCIGNGAFAYCNNLSTIVIADGVRFINSLAFTNCISLTEIEIPKSIIQIESMAFRGCQGLLSITVEEGNLNYYSAGNCIIEKMTNKLIIGCNYSTIPLDDSVEQIGSFAFSSCLFLESLIVPVSLKEIQRYAFDECAALNIVYYLGTQKDWANIKIDSYENEAIINANIYFYSENLPTSSGNYWRYVNGVPTTW